MAVAIEQARIGRDEGGVPIGAVVVAENETFIGAEELLRVYGVEVVVRRSQECIDLMAEFIASHPHVWHEDIGEFHDATPTDLSGGA